jgi:xylulokinase
VVFLPYLMGERTPHADARARGAFVGLSARTTRDDLARAVMEGIVFGIADLLACTAAVDRPIRVDALRMTGGGARSPLFRTLLADVLGVPIETTENPEGGALGAAILGAVAAGAFASVDAGVAACVRIAGRTAPDETKRAAYAAPLAAYRALYPACREVMHRLSENG